MKTVLCFSHRYTFEVKFSDVKYMCHVELLDKNFIRMKRQGLRLNIYIHLRWI